MSEMEVKLHKNEDGDIYVVINGKRTICLNAQGYIYINGWYVKYVDGDSPHNNIINMSNIFEGCYD